MSKYDDFFKKGGLYWKDEVLRKIIQTLYDYLYFKKAPRRVKKPNPEKEFNDMAVWYTDEEIFKRDQRRKYTRKMYDLRRRLDGRKALYLEKKKKEKESLKPVPANP